MRDAKRPRLVSPAADPASATDLSTTTASRMTPPTQAGPPSSLTALGQRLFGLACADEANSPTRPERAGEGGARAVSPTRGDRPPTTLAPANARELAAIRVGIWGHCRANPCAPKVRPRRRVRLGSDSLRRTNSLLSLRCSRARHKGRKLRQRRRNVHARRSSGNATRLSNE